MLKLFYIIQFWIMFGLALTAQPGHSSFVHYTTDDGLSNDNIRDILKDQIGFLWVATQNGLNRFDGHGFRHFFHNPHDSHSLPDNLVRFLTIAPDGLLWVVTQTGICRIDPSTLEFQRFYLPEHRDQTDENDQVGRVIFDEVGNGWVCGKDALHCFDPASAEVCSYTLEQSGIGRFSTYYDRTGKIWLIENATISYFDTSTEKFKTLSTDTPGNPLKGAAPLYVAEDAQGQLWVTTWFKGLARYDNQLDSLLDYPDGDVLTSVILPSQDQSYFWLGGGQYGLFLFYPEGGDNIQFPPDPRDLFTHNNYIATALYQDPRTGTIWIGTEAGMEHHSPKSLRFGRVILPIDVSFGQFSLMSDIVQDFSDRSGNTYYIAMWGSGLFRWKRRENEFKHLHEKNTALDNNGIFCLLQDTKGNLWMGAKGVNRYNPITGKWRHWDCFSEKIKEKVMVMSAFEDSYGGLWFGTNRGGLFRYNPLADHMEEVLLPPAAYPPSGRLRITSMKPDPQGMVWMATHHRPLRLDPHTGTVEVFEIKNARPEYNSWTDVHLARSGLLYATSGNSLLEMDSTCLVLRQFDQTNGLRSNEVYQIEEDLKGRLWVNTSYLLHCLDPHTGRFNYFGTPDGLFKNTVTDALVTLPDGELVIGFQNALNHFYPSRLQHNSVPPPVAITSTRVMDQERRPIVKEQFYFRDLFSKKEIVRKDTMLVVGPKEKIFTIQFAALVFIQPGRNRYAYKLEGFNDDWVYTDQNFATYTNLDGGSYCFRVKAANNDGVWNEQGTKLLVRVTPPLTRRWYFFALMGIFGAFILLVIRQYRRQQRRRLAAFRESLARDLHDEMGSTLSSIRFFGEFAKTQVADDQPQVAAILQRIILSASALSESMHDIIWAMRWNHEQLEDLSARMTEFGLRIFEARNIDFHTNLSKNFSVKTLSPEMRRNLYLIFKEAVNNAAKYSEASEVELSLSIKNGWLLMKISDNGQGFVQGNSPTEKNGGNGLSNMRKRAEAINGNLEILTEKNQGTSVEVRVRL